VAARAAEGLSAAGVEEFRRTLAESLYKKYDALMEVEEKTLLEGIRAREMFPLKSCSRCKVVAYCSKECQGQDWSRHKKVCQAPVPNE